MAEISSNKSQYLRSGISDEQESKRIWSQIEEITLTLVNTLNETYCMKSPVCLGVNMDII